MDVKCYTVIVGLGKTGLSSLHYCLRESLPVAVTDSREVPPCFKAYEKVADQAPGKFGELSRDLILNASQIILSPGVSLKEPVIAEAIVKGIPCMGDVELFSQAAQAPIIAITGSNAKSTVTALVGEMIKSAGSSALVGGNIGEPVLDLLKEPVPDFYVLELSSFQLETTRSLKAKVATILNITEDHMDRYDTFVEYIQAKQRIYQNCQTAVFNRLDQKTVPYDNVPKNISFGLDAPEAQQYGMIKKNEEIYLACGDRLLLKGSELALPGQHNIENALAALALCDAASLDIDACLTALKTFKGLKHRCQLVRELNGVKWYNDSKGTNVGATIAALNGLGSRKNVILIAGGVGKGADFSLLYEPVASSTKQLILFGEATDEMAGALKGAVDISKVNSLDEAVRLAKALAKKNDIVLLSPACASFDLFKNFEDRGDQFIKLVEAL